jgi:hypothetical protein
MGFGELADVFAETEEVNRARGGVSRCWFVLERRAREENAMPRRWRDGMVSTRAGLRSWPCFVHSDLPYGQYIDASHLDSRVPSDDKAQLR